MLVEAIQRIVGSKNERELKRVRPLVDTINELEPDMRSLTDRELRTKTDEFRKRLSQGETLDDLLPEAFAAVREASCRTLGMRHFDVQVIGGIVLHQGKIAEMKTGEGKTLAATLAAYLNALHRQGRPHRHGQRLPGPQGPGLDGPDLRVPGAHRRRDPARHGQPGARSRPTVCDITYGTNNEFGFDYLRDNLKIDPDECVQREHHYAIVDEVDSILIDEARTPLIISGQVEKSSHRYNVFNLPVRQLVSRQRTPS